jgi:hypothetical protein
MGAQKRMQSLRRLAAGALIPTVGIKGQVEQTRDLVAPGGDESGAGVRSTSRPRVHSPARRL